MKFILDTDKQEITLLEKVSIDELLDTIEDLDISIDMSEWSIIPKELTTHEYTPWIYPSTTPYYSGHASTLSGNNIGSCTTGTVSLTNNTLSNTTKSQIENFESYLMDCLQANGINISGDGILTVKDVILT